MEITKEIQFDYGHIVHFHSSLCRHPHGHRAKVVVHVIGELVHEEVSEEGMVMDFKHIKRIMMENIHDVLDHSFIISKNAPQLPLFQQMSLSNYGDKMRLVVIDAVPTAENLAKWCWDHIFESLTDAYGTGLRLSAVEFWETPTSCAIYAPALQLNELIKDNQSHLVDDITLTKLMSIDKANLSDFEEEPKNLNEEN